MTCVVGLEGECRVWIGADSASSNYYTINSSDTPKVFQVGAYIFGIAGDWNLSPILHYRLQAPNPPKAGIDRFVNTVFLDAVRECFKAAGYMRVKENQESQDGSFLVGVSGKLYRVQGDMSCTSPRGGYEAIGSGTEFALGVMSDLAKVKPQERIRRALTAAAKHNPYVEAPFSIKCGGKV